MSKKKAEQPEFLVEVLELQEKIDSVKKRLALVEENRDKVRQKIYEKVKSDYESSLEDLFGQLQPFREKIDSEIVSLQESIQVQQSIVDLNQEELEEFQLRFFAGEFGDDEFQPKQESLMSTIEAAREKIAESERGIDNFREHLAFISGDEIEEKPELISDEPELMAEESEVVDASVEQDEDVLSDDLIPEQIEEPLEEAVEEPEEGEPGYEDPAGTDEEPEEYQEFQPEADLDDLSFESTSQKVDRLMKDTVSEPLFLDNDAAAPLQEVDPADEEEYIWNCIPVLDVVDGDFTGESYTIDKERITMGRGPNNDIQLATDTSVSRHHAQIVLEGNKYFLVDLDSSNGSSVNGMRVMRAALRPNDEVTIGVSKMIIRTQD